MTNDERKLLEDRIYQYGTAAGKCASELSSHDEEWRAFDRVMDVVTNIQLKGEKDATRKPNIKTL